MINKPEQRYLIASRKIDPDVIQYQEAIDFLKEFKQLSWESAFNIVNSLCIGGKYWVNDSSILVRLKDLKQ